MSINDVTMDPPRKPWMKFYPTDWQADEGLHQCSLSARGLWIEMISIMHKSRKYGYLLIAGLCPTIPQIALQVGTNAESVGQGIAELEKWQVLSRDKDGVIFSRRMLRDEAKATQDILNGKGGGNPSLKRRVNPPVNQVVKEMDKAQRPEARYQKESK